MKYRHCKLCSLEYWKNRNETLHNDLFDLLDDTMNRLKSNGIEAFISEGTLLGSIREKNIIAWDDDMDISIYHKKNDYFFRKNIIFLRSVKKQAGGDAKCKINFAWPNA